MPELREVFEMTTKQMGEPDLDSWREQEKRQRKASRNKKLGAIAVAAALVIAGVVIGISTLGNDDVQPASSGANPSRPIPEPSPSEAPLRSIVGCIPECLTGGVNPGPLPTGTYQTVWFFGGEMRVTLESGWTSREDNTGGFVLGPGASPENEIFFWEDVYPLENGKRVKGVPMTTSGLLRWLSSNSNLETTKPKNATIGNLPATVVDVSIARGAANEDPNCPSDVCRIFLSFPQWDDVWGIAGRQVQRFYLSDVRYGGVNHLFVAVVYPDDPADLEAFASQAELVINSVQVPARPT